MSSVDTAVYERAFAEAGLDYEYGHDGPGKVYTSHQHGWTKLITLGGSVRIRSGNADWMTLHTGDAYEVQSGEEHQAIVGDDGWDWLAAWKPEEADTFIVHE